MSLKSNSSESSDTSRTPKLRTIEDSYAAHFALRVALQTMKERCQQLQERLTRVEEENMRLRIEQQNNSQNEKKGAESDQLSILEGQVAQLGRQKSQLTHHIFMVANENKQLWTRLSRLTEANQSLGSHLNKISDTLNKHPYGESAKPNQSINIVNSCEKDRTDVNEESLEDISLKIITSIMKEKEELEQQYEQMVELQSGAAVNMAGCDFVLSAAVGSNPEEGEGYGEVGEGDEEMTTEIGSVLESLRDERATLKQQQDGLRAAIDAISNVATGISPCPKCQSAGKETIKPLPGLTVPLMLPDQVRSQLLDITEPPYDVGANSPMQPSSKEATTRPEDRLCPLCGAFFHATAPFDRFNEHVMSHFEEGDDDEEGGSGNSFVANFEVVT